MLGRKLDQFGGGGGGKLPLRPPPPSLDEALTAVVAWATGLGKWGEEGKHDSRYSAACCQSQTGFFNNQLSPSTSQ